MLKIPPNNDMYEIMINTIIIYHVSVYKLVLYDFALGLAD
jgi:hypothetical protein